ncbi:ribonucleoside-diphosphate reductase subunit alpha [Acidithiobacillus marinus]|uniref:Ribonucleoside-diphosphate reductase n=1 Tax=Acidithiobacillus marinus TaxID=187490 RepID=A0A2I1DIN7_9PROT|nr:ribonucleoside-diphosphate reductase subunit alpha [Acidithiobacillus marinus]PKY09741.1 ribonucleoside-diphosphate reductase subunit alpha [Acidithiobacillus marinus]
MVKIQKRDGSIVPFDAVKIQNAVIMAVLKDQYGDYRSGPTLSAAGRDVANHVSEQVLAVLEKRPNDGVIFIEDIQDQVELAFMRAGEHRIARDYVLFREKRAKERAAVQAPDVVEGIETDNGFQTFETLLGHLSLWAPGLLGNSGVLKERREAVFAEMRRSLYPGISQNEIRSAAIMAARTLIESDPVYSRVASAFLVTSVREEASRALGLPEEAFFYNQYFPAYVQFGIEDGRLDPRLADFDLEFLATRIADSRDFDFEYLGMQVLYDRYLIHHREKRIEAPQALWMRVAMGLALAEEPSERDRTAVEFYNVLSQFLFVSSTPTLFNAGTTHPQLSSCFLTTVPDDLDGIFEAIKENALLSKFSGGLGNDWTPVRSLGSYIKGTNGKSQGVVPFLKVVNDTAVAVNQGGKRKGAVCAYLETWHMDIEEFLELRKNTGDDRRRTHDMNTANWIPDLFMERVEQNAEWTLFSPVDVPDLHDLYGSAFSERYAYYEQQAELGVFPSKKVSAVQLWRKMLTMIFETGHPWITFKDACNLRNPQQHDGVVHSSNLCTEITLNTNAQETAVCNLGSVNLLAHMKPAEGVELCEQFDGSRDDFLHQYFDIDKLNLTISTAMQMLDNVISMNWYASEKGRFSNTRHRPVGLGLMGVADALMACRIPYGSEAAVLFSDVSQEVVSFMAINASASLARSRGAYESFDGSLWSQGILPIDSVALRNRSSAVFDMDTETCQTLVWDGLREFVKGGMRNSNCLAIAPTATISNISGVSQGIDPIYQNLHVKSNLSGEFTVLNRAMVEDLKRLDLWDEVMVNDLKYFDGSLGPIDRVPEVLKKLYATAFEVGVDHEGRDWLVRCAAKRQKWVDQAISLNLYMAQASGAKIDRLYRQAWHSGLKTTYYLRSLGATAAEKSTVQGGQLNAVSVQPKACAIDDPTCEACT